MYNEEEFLYQGNKNSKYVKEIKKERGKMTTETKPVPLFCLRHSIINNLKNQYSLSLTETNWIRVFLI